MFSDSKIREKIVDQASFTEALERVLRSDPSLSNIPMELSRSGETLEMCGTAIFENPSIQQIIKSNVSKKRRDISTRVREANPSWTRGQRAHEVNRRLNIFITTSSQKIKQTKQVTISEALRPVKVEGYSRGSQTIKSYKKTNYRELTTQERMLLENGISRGKKPSDIIKDYMQAGLPYRTETSIRRHYYRMKGKG